ARLHAASAGLAQRQRRAAGRRNAGRRSLRRDPGVRAQHVQATFAVRLQSGAGCALVAPGGFRALACNRALGRRQWMGAAAAQRLDRRMDIGGCRAKARPTWGLLLALWAGLAGAETIATVNSPRNVLSASVTIDEEGKPGYTLSRNGRPIVTESRLGFLLTD